MIRLGGLVWTRAQAIEFWLARADLPICGWLSPYPPVIVAHLAQRHVEQKAVDRIGGAILRPGRCCVPRDAANE